ncbi:MAG: M15 family metallopeptidase [Bacilli bacterium]|nr:M15 family metallopeptidase [Bacilli bacterium]
MLNENNELIAKKEGTSYIKIKHKADNIQKKVKIKVISKKNNIEVRDGLTYIDGILIVNKTYRLPKDYDPGKLNEDALNAFYEMRKDAAKDNITLWIQSGYRSYSTQSDLYENYVKKDGKEKSDTYSARPGHSEHQTGLAMDLNIIDSSFEGTKEAIWIAKNSYKYGFIIRYPKEKENITGYKYEPWHIRYLGKEIAKKVYDSGLTLEEYLHIDSKYSE